MKLTISHYAVFLFLSLVLITGSSLVTTGQTDEKPHKKKSDNPDAPAVLWREPTDIASRDLFYGVGGKDHAPWMQGRLHGRA